MADPTPARKLKDIRARRRESGSCRKADMPDERVECLLMTQSGH